MLAPRAVWACKIAGGEGTGAEAIQVAMLVMVDDEVLDGDAVGARRRSLIEVDVVRLN
jgi:hypothetical protein